MSTYKPIKDNDYYRQDRSVIPHKPIIHFYPDVTDKDITEGELDIEFTLSYKDTLDQIQKGVDDIHTMQMSFANPKTAEKYRCLIHLLDIPNNTQRIGLLAFSNTGEFYIKEWL